MAGSDREIRDGKLRVGGNEVPHKPVRVGVRQVESGSWLDPKSSAAVGYRVGKRLWERVAGEEGLFLTLTYDRSRFDGALDLYRRQAEEQHVPLFMRRLGRALGVSFVGKWFCKLEFQDGGFVHFHIVLLHDKRIPQKLIAAAWGHGFVWVEKLNKKRVFYCCKYVCKGGQAMPRWLLLEAPRSVKIVRVSPGFWGEASRKRVEPDEDYEKWGPGRPQRVDGYVPLGARLERPARVSVRTSQGGFVVPQSLLEWALAALASGARPAGREGGWLWYEWPTWEERGGAVGEHRTRASERAVEAQPAAEPPLHLKAQCNPDAGWPAYLREWVMEGAAERVLETCWGVAS